MDSIIKTAEDIRDKCTLFIVVGIGGSFLGTKAVIDASTVAIAYDSRIESDLFSQVAAGVLAANGIGVHLWPQLMPVPALSYAVRALGASAGIVVTASHNPSAYNGYKVYGADGCQITTQASEEILAEITKLDMFEDINTCPFHEAVEDGKIKYISDDVYTDFIEEVKNRSVLFGEEVNKDIAIVYTPLNGAELGTVTRVLKESGYTNITVVKEQEQPDGNFPTCPYPNPEIREAMELGGRKIVSALDYSEGIDGLPKSTVLQFYLEDSCSVIVRPSGTEPKIKVYITVSAETGEAVEAAEQELSKRIEGLM